jgi:hypothetical protein
MEFSIESWERYRLNAKNNRHKLGKSFPGDRSGLSVYIMLKQLMFKLPIDAKH